MGRQGPNLSGFFTSFYPKTAPGERAWSEKVLTDWVANPRALRPGAVMPPVPLDPAELQQVMESIRAITPVAVQEVGTAGTSAR
jgi:cytochrome c2